MSTSSMRTGLLWVISLVLLAGLAQAENVKKNTVTTDSSLTLTEKRVPVNQARVSIFSPDGARLYTGVSKTDKNGFTTISLQEGLEFKLEIKIGPNIYFTGVYTAPAQIKFDPFNTAPVATDLSITTDQGTAVAITLAGSDADDDPLAFTYTQPANGTLSGTAPNLTYTPNAGFSGNDSFTYKADDGIALSNSATVAITVTVPFIISVNATDGTFTLPLKSGLTYDFTATYDGVTTAHDTDANLTLTFPSGPGIYDVTISGTFPAINFNNAGDKDKLLDVKQWGTVAWQTMNGAFYGCSNLQISAADTPNLSGVTDMASMLRSCNALTTLDVTDWDMSSVENLYRTFAYTRKLMLVGCENWNMPNVKTFYNMFQKNEVMTSIDISNWNTTDKLTDLSRMFASSSFTEIKGLKDLDVTNVTIMHYMLPPKFTMSTAEYDELLISWAAEVTQPQPSAPEFGANGAKYTPGGAAAAAREHLLAMNWRITDGGPLAGCAPYSTASITSPVRVSGWSIAQEQSDVTISTDGGMTFKPVVASGDSWWYYDVDLSITDAVPVVVNYQDTTLSTDDFTWTPTLIDGDCSRVVTIRKDTSLLLGSAVQTGSSLEIDINADGTIEYSGAPTDLFPALFSEFGTFEVVTYVDGVETGYMTVYVPEVIFPESIACELGYTRQVTAIVPENPSAITFGSKYGPEFLEVAPSTEPALLPDRAKLTARPKVLDSAFTTIVAQGSSGPLYEKSADVFTLRSTNHKFYFLKENEDGSCEGTIQLVMQPKVDNLIIKLQATRIGVTFDDSTMTKTINSDDFVYDEAMQAWVYSYMVILADGVTGTAACNMYAAYQTSSTEEDGKPERISRPKDVNPIGIMSETDPKCVAKDSGDTCETKLWYKSEDDAPDRTLAVTLNVGQTQAPKTIYLSKANTKDNPGKSGPYNISDNPADYYDLEAYVSDPNGNLSGTYLVEKLAVVEFSIKLASGPKYAPSAGTEVSGKAFEVELGDRLGFSVGLVPSDVVPSDVDPKLITWSGDLISGTGTSVKTDGAYTSIGSKDVTVYCLGMSKSSTIYVNNNLNATVKIAAIKPTKEHEWANVYTETIELEAGASTDYDYVEGTVSETNYIDLAKTKWKVTAASGTDKGYVVPKVGETAKYFPPLTGSYTGKVQITADYQDKPAESVGDFSDIEYTPRDDVMQRASVEVGIFKTIVILNYDSDYGSGTLKSTQDGKNYILEDGEWKKLDNPAFMGILNKPIIGVGKSITQSEEDAIKKDHLARAVNFNWYFTTTEGDIPVRGLVTATCALATAGKMEVTVVDSDDKDSGVKFTIGADANVGGGAGPVSAGMGFSISREVEFGKDAHEACAGAAYGFDSKNSPFVQIHPDKTKLTAKSSDCKEDGTPLVLSQKVAHGGAKTVNKKVGDVMYARYDFFNCVDVKRVESIAALPVYYRTCVANSHYRKFTCKATVVGVTYVASEE